MQAALTEHDVVLRSAVGAHGGEVFKHTGDGICAVFGSVSSAVAAAVMAQAMDAGHGGQILVSAVAAALLDGVVLTGLGEHRLRDLAVPMRAFQVGTATFPPLRVRSAFRTNLAKQMTSLVGRRSELSVSLVAGRRTPRRRARLTCARPFHCNGRPGPGRARRD